MRLRLTCVISPVKAKAAKATPANRRKRVDCAAGAPITLDDALHGAADTRQAKGRAARPLKVATATTTTDMLSEYGAEGFRLEELRIRSELRISPRRVNALCLSSLLPGKLHLATCAATQGLGFPTQMSKRRWQWRL